MNRHYPDVARRAGHRCEYCRAPEGIFNFPFEVEHVRPTAAGGTDADDNLALACRACNLAKAAHQTGWDDTVRADVALFSPRSDRWDQHFEPDLDGGEIRGLTPIGRATVDRLRMNDPAQVVARQLWIRLRLFP
jgi:hypothetical protein